MKPRTLENLALVCLLLVFAAVAGGIALYVQSVHTADEEQLETIEPRFARLAGLATDKGQLAAAVAATKVAVSRHIYPASREASQAGNDAQQRARDVFSRAGLEVLSSQVLPAKSGKQFDRIPITVRLEGDFLVFQAALAAMPSLTPTLFVDGFNIQTVASAKPDVPRLVVQIELFVLRARS